MHKGMASIEFLITSLLLVLFLQTATIGSGYGSASTIVLVDPPASTVQIDGNFSVYIDVTDVVDLYGWEFKMRWNTAVLDVVGVTEGPFLKQGGTTFLTYKINSTQGYILVDCTLLGVLLGVSGNGILAAVMLHAKALGSSVLDLCDTILVDSNELAISHTSIDGSVEVLPSVHDVAIIGVVPSKTVVGQGLTLRVWVIIENQGGYTETFEVSVYYNSVNLIGRLTTALTSLSSTTLTFRWNTTGMSKGNYILSAIASTVLGEVDVADNTHVDGSVTVAMIGDISGPIVGVPDGRVDIRDIAMVAKAFGSFPGYPNWNQNADVNDDDKVDIKDVALLAKNYGKIDP